jgi:hypothetical protein
MMKKMFFALPVAVLALAGCAKESAGEGRDGSGSLSIDFSATEQVGVFTTRVPGTIPGVTAPEKNLFTLYIYPDGQEYDDSPDYNFGDITTYDKDAQKFQRGNYYAMARYGNPDVEGFAADGVPAFGGTSSVIVVVADGETTTSIEAAMLHMGVSVEFTEKFKNYYPDHSAVITRVAASEPVVEFAEGEDRVAFLKPGKFNLTVNYTRVGGEPKTVTYEIEDNVTAATWHKAKIDATGEIGQGTITITWDGTIQDVPTPIDVHE